MQALTYHGSHDVRVERVPDPVIEQPDDIILRVTATAICGSDLHLYRGKIPQVKHGDSDILPTGYQAVVNAGIGPGSSLAIFGAGPVGLMSAACARMLGAELIFMVDHHPYRLEYARQTYGVIPIDFERIDDPAAAIIENTPGFRGGMR